MEPSEYPLHISHVQSTTPAHMDHNVSPDTAIEVIFKPSINERTLQRYMEHNDEGGLYGRRFENKWHEYDEDTKQSFPFTDFKLNSSFMVLKIRDLLCAQDIVRSLNRVKYHAFGKANEGYDGGDSRSWQMYTRNLPVEGSLNVSMNPPRITFSPSMPLSPGWYAIALLHTAGTPQNKIIDDGLIPFHVIPTQNPLSSVSQHNPVANRVALPSPIRAISAPARISLSCELQASSQIGICENTVFIWYFSNH